jgi:hypothetical protein
LRLFWLKLGLLFSFGTGVPSGCPIVSRSIQLFDWMMQLFPSDLKLNTLLNFGTELVYDPEANRLSSILKK